MSETTFVSASEHQVFSVLDDESVILDLEEGIYYGLDTVGTRIWELLQNPIEVSELISTIEQEYDVERARCSEDIFNLLEDLEKHNLVNVNNTKKDERLKEKD